MQEAFNAKPESRWEQKYVSKEGAGMFLVEENIANGYEKAVRAPGVRLLIRNSKGEILLTSEIRYEHGGSADFRLPGGKVFEDIGSYLKVRKNDAALQEAVKQAAENEAREEAGISKIDNLALLQRSPNGSTVEWDLYYMTGNADELGEQQLHGDEAVDGIGRKFYTPAEVLEMLQKGLIKEDRTVAVLYREILKGVNPTKIF